MSSMSLANSRRKGMNIFKTLEEMETGPDNSLANASSDSAYSIGSMMLRSIGGTVSISCASCSRKSPHSQRLSRKWTPAVEPLTRSSCLLMARKVRHLVSVSQMIWFIRGDSARSRIRSSVISRFQPSSHLLEETTVEV